ncbi:haloacid dehalogenase-like hydrolase [Myxococcus sp. K15C18031901]|uniref:HAD family hydrolase n=1 Tax=Myxococcus dinghuensis TaxID=2906761 RepID=UPI0020A7E332|nr:haloacid dehalogenase-like hydrolase [Myxococcus dinghuensis]MCP3103335.1 haloacid dehalogenase-like hydrolase [Myxococcus dinghuensis]
MRRLAVLDLDGTLTPDVLGALLMRELVARGVCDVVHGQHMLELLLSHRAGQPEAASTAAHVYQSFGRAVEGVAVSAVERVAEAVWARARGRLFAFVKPLVRELERSGFLVALVSGSPMEVVHLAASELGVDICRGAVLEIRRNRYTGRVLEAPGLEGARRRILQDLAELHQVSLPESLAMGCAVEDAELFEQVGIPIAFEPVEVLAQLAMRHGWTVVHRQDVLQVLTGLKVCAAQRVNVIRFES